MSVVFGILVQGLVFRDSGGSGFRFWFTDSPSSAAGQMAHIPWEGFLALLEASGFWSGLGFRVEGSPFTCTFVRQAFFAWQRRRHWHRRSSRCVCCTRHVVSLFISLPLSLSLFPSPPLSSPLPENSLAQRNLRTCTLRLSHMYTCSCTDSSAYSFALPCTVVVAHLVFC